MAGKQPGLLSRDAILGAVDVQVEDIEVPEWGGTVRIRGLSGTERDEYEAWIISGKGRNRDINLRNSRAKLVALCVVDEQGSRVFDPGDVAALGKKSAIALQRVFDKAAALSGLDDDALEKIQDDLGNAPSDDSGSA